MLSIAAKKISLNTGMKNKKKNSIFICQISESALKVIKCVVGDNFKRRFVGLELQMLPADIDDKKLAENLALIFRKLGYEQNPVIISLPRSKVATRHLKVPTQIPGEIESIVSLQASRYLPYPNEELITAYQILSTEKDGYAKINLIIVHKDVIERYTRILKEIKCVGFSIVLSSYGLGNFYDYLHPNASETVMLVDIDYQQVEIAIFFREKLLFSRYLKVDSSQPNWENLFMDEILKTRDAYSKEVADKIIHRIMLTGAGKTYQQFAQVLHQQQMDLPIEALPYDKIGFSDDLLNKISNAENSFASIIGLGLRNWEETLNLLPQEVKEKSKAQVRHKERLQLVLLIFIIFFIMGLGITKNLDNKTKYLKQLKLELNKIDKEARLLEEIEKRLQLMRQRSEKRFSSPDLLYELHQAIPEHISLVSLSYEADNQVILRGQTQELNAVFSLVAKLEKSPPFSGFNIKVRYATQKKTQRGEIVDFEVVCAKK